MTSQEAEVKIKNKNTRQLQGVERVLKIALKLMRVFIDKGVQKAV